MDRAGGQGVERDRYQDIDRDKKIEAERYGNREIKPEIAFSAHCLKMHLHCGGPRTYLRASVSLYSTGCCRQHWGVPGPVLGLSVGSR